MNREAYYSALFAHLQAQCPSVKTFSRKLKHWSEVDPPDCPALFQAQANQRPQQVKGLPYFWRFDATLYVYIKNEDIDAAPAVLLNQILDEVEAALALDNLMRLNFNLSFLDTVRIEGEIETDEGILGDTAIAIIPVMGIVTQ